MIAGSPGSRDYLFAAIKWSQTHPNAWGDPGSYPVYGPMWAQVSMTPFSQYKGWLAEGGIRNALVVSGPAVKRPKGSINHGLMHVSDLMPTLLEIAGTSYPKSREGHDLPPLMGKSWARCWRGRRSRHARSRTPSPGRFSATGRCGRGSGSSAGNTSRSARATGSFSTSPLIRRAKRLAAERPDKLQALLALWDSYVRTNNVVLPSRSPFETMEDQLPERVPVNAGYPPLVNKRQFVPPRDMMAEPKKQ